MPSPAERQDPRPLLDQSQAAEFLAVSTRTLEGWRSSGGGPRFVRVGRRVRYRLRDLQQWVDVRTFGSSAEVGRRWGIGRRGRAWLAHVARMRLTA